MIVYRIEDNYDNGPFHSGFSSTLSPEKQRAWYEHTSKLPTLRGEVPEFRYSDYPGYISGVPSLDLLDKWFKPFYNVLGRRGHVISKYDVDECFVISSKLQLVFQRDSAVLVKRGKRWQFRRESAP
jgi:hypothetical protein